MVNTARGAICNAEDVAAAVESGQLNGYAGDVWNVQPAPKDHPWRKMLNPLGGGNGMYVQYTSSHWLLLVQGMILILVIMLHIIYRVPHVSGTSLDAQARYASGVKTILENFFDGKPQNPHDIIVTGGDYATKAYGERKK